MKKEFSFILICLFLLSIICTAARGQQNESIPEAGSPTIEDVKAVQAVFNSDINGDGIQEVVAGKSLVALVYLNESCLNGLDKKQAVKVKVVYDGKPYFNNTATVEDITKTAYVPVRVGPAAGTGIKTITATVDWDGRIPGLRGYDNTLSSKINVVRTKGLKVLVVPIDGPDDERGYGPVNPADYDRLFNQSYQFMKAVYPVADSEIEFIKYDGHMEGSPYIKGRNKNSTSLGMVRDVKELAKLGDEYGCDRVVGIVPRGYYIYHKKPRGGSILGNSMSKKLFTGHSRSVLVREDSKTGIVTAHEIGHSYGLNTGKKERGEEYASEKYHNKHSGGFNAAKMKAVNGPCFMDSGAIVPRTYWICEDTWKELFNKFLA